MAMHQANIARDACSIPCNLCGARDVEQVGSVDRHGKSLRTVICKRCGLVWTDPRPSSEENRHFYAEDYRLKYKRIYTPKLKHAYRETCRALERAESIAPILRSGMRVLDVGSGGGFFLYVLGRRGMDGQGVEPNKGFAGYSQQELGVKTINGFLQEVKLPNQSFDVVTLNHVLEHLEDPWVTLCRLKYLAKRDGYVVIEVPNIEATYHAPNNRFHIGHLYNFNRATLERFGVKAGLSVHRSTLIPGTNHLHVIFRNVDREPSTVQDWAIEGNYQHVRNFLKTHTTLRHFASATPYQRFVRKQMQNVREWREVRHGQSGKDIVDQTEIRPAA